MTEPKPCTPIPCPPWQSVEFRVVPRLEPPSVDELRQAGMAIHREGETFWSLRDGAVAVVDRNGAVVHLPPEAP